MSSWNKYRTYEDFEREELWSSDLLYSTLSGLDDAPRGDPERPGAADDEGLDELDFDLD